MIFSNLAAPAPASAQGTCWDVRIQGHTTCDFSSSGGGGGGNYQFSSANWNVFFENLANFLDSIFGTSRSRPPAHVLRAKEFLDKAIALRDKGDYVNSISYFERALAADPTGANNWIKANIAWNQGQLAIRLWQREDYVGAFEYLSAAAQYDPSGYGKDLAEIRKWAKIQQSMRDQAREGRRIVEAALGDRSNSGPSAQEQPTYNFDVAKANLLAELKRSNVVEGSEDEVTRDFFGQQGSPREDLKIELLENGGATDRVAKEDLIIEALPQAESAKHQGGRAVAATGKDLKETAHREASKPFDRPGTAVSGSSGLPEVLDAPGGAVVDVRDIELRRSVLEAVRNSPEWKEAAQRREKLHVELSREQDKLAGLQERYDENKARLNRTEVGRFQVKIAIQKRAVHRIEQQIAAVESEQKRIYDRFESGMYEEREADEQSPSSQDSSEGNDPSTGQKTH